MLRKRNQTHWKHAVLFHSYSIQNCHTKTMVLRGLYLHNKIVTKETKQSLHEEVKKKCQISDYLEQGEKDLQSGLGIQGFCLSDPFYCTGSVVLTSNGGSLFKQVSWCLRCTGKLKSPIRIIFCMAIYTFRVFYICIFSQCSKSKYWY